MTVTVLTAVYDGYDTLKPLRPQTVAHEAICITDDPDLKADGWDIVYEPRDVRPVIAAKRPKAKPWLYTDADITIWIDASFRVVSWEFVADLTEYEFAQFDHPDRDCIYTEAEYSLTLPKYEREPLAAQADHYRTRGHPERWGLWANGVMVRKDSPQLRDFGERWLTEIETWSAQCQVSSPPVFRDCGIRPASLPGNVFTNRWMVYEASARHGP